MTTFIDLLSENNTVELSLVHTSTTSAILSWTLPLDYQAYDGAVVILSTSPITSANHPSNGSAYNGSSDWNAPVSTIGGANVIAAIYGSRFNDVTINTASITNLAANIVYYAAVFICDSIRQYAPAVLSYSKDNSTPNLSTSIPGGSIQETLTPPLNPILGEVYYNPSTNKVSMWNGSAWQEVLTSTVTTGTVFPTGTAYTKDPVQNMTNNQQITSSFNNIIHPLTGPVLPGTFFFNTVNKTLFCYDGTNWNKTNTSQPNVPVYEKIAIGTNGSDIERIELVDELKSQLGWPAVCVELKEEQFNVAINLALRSLRRWSDSAYKRKHLLYALHPNQSTYYLNNPEDDSDKIVDVIKIHRMSQFGLNSTNQENGLYNQPFLNTIFQAGQMIDILSIYEVASLAETMSTLFAGELMSEWRENTRELRILRKLFREEVVVLECVMERTEQDLLLDRWNRPWLQDWALACCYEQLGMIRGKYQSLPGANGISMNGSELSQKAESMKIELQRQIIDYELGNALEFGSGGILLG